MKKTTAFILVVLALFAGYWFGSMSTRSSPDVVRSSNVVTSSASSFGTSSSSTKSSSSSTRSSSSVVSSSYAQKSDLHDYVANKKTKKFHKPSCSSVKQMNESNKKYFYSVTRQSMIDNGYDPCGRCHP